MEHFLHLDGIDVPTEDPAPKFEPQWGWYELMDITGRLLGIFDRSIPVDLYLRKQPAGTCCRLINRRRIVPEGGEPIMVITKRCLATVRPNGQVVRDAVNRFWQIESQDPKPMGPADPV